MNVPGKQKLQSETNEDENFPELTAEQNALLDERIAMEDEGLITFSSWEDAKARILAGRRKA